MATKNSYKDSDERKKLLKSAKVASSNAKKVSAALDLSIKVISKGSLIERSPNGKITTIKVIEKVKANKPGIKKGTVLCLK